MAFRSDAYGLATERNKHLELTQKMKNSEKQCMRLFYALWPNEATRAALMRLQAPITGRKSRYENFHLTLAFLGQQPVNLLPIFKTILAALPAHPVTLQVNRIDYFPKKKIAWAGMHETPATLTELNRNLVDALVQNNIVFDSASAFCPHITLARGAAAPEEYPSHFFTWQCEHIALLESTNQPEGVVYRVLASRFLGHAEKDNYLN